MDFLLSSISIVTIIVCIIVFVFLQLIAKKLQAEQGKKKYHPIGGTVLHQLMNFNRLHDYMTDLAGKHKTYRLIGLFRSEVYTSDPANVEYMLKTNFENYGKGLYNYTILKDLLGDGIFSVDGDKWRKQRKVSSYEFSTRVLRDFSSVVFRKNIVKVANFVSEAAIASRPFDIQDLFMKATLDSIFRVAFGVELDSMCGSNEEGARFSNAFDDASAMTLWRYVDVSWKIKKVLGVGSEAKLKKNIKMIDEFVFKLISSKIEQVHKSEFDEPIVSRKEDILSRFLLLTETDPKYLRDIILNFIIAGKDTTATTLSWFIYMLCKHPLVQEKIAEDIKQATNPKDGDVLEIATNVTEESLEKMHYLHASLTETLRLYPAVPVRMPDGFSVKKGDMVSYQPYAMGRMRFIWGEDAENFKPERWLDENGCFQPQSPFKFTAFQEFAYRQMKIFSAVLLRCFIFKLGDETKPVKYRTMINLHIDGGLTVQAFPRPDSKAKRLEASH